jgi:hypothetical protein
MGEDEPTKLVDSRHLNQLFWRRSCITSCAPRANVRRIDRFLDRHVQPPELITAAKVEITRCANCVGMG